MQSIFRAGTLKTTELPVKSRIGQDGVSIPHRYAENDEVETDEYMAKWGFNSS